ncbi:hypothetical protein AAZX31_11G205000 [Glycine max]|uniref:G domain-containing protein n=1 Tax=Glycine max TaxID=3847 RepID=K7LR43_SOYBN|nr:hypothetical protein JHK87_031723 [Glycine soja]KAG4989465.1 hypothetical protein JHK85_032448 [Glycine max]KAG4995054.1 hypothetical protein JHK86_031881 [Glycine max]KAG5125053.1 hypothetical protein JHK82_031790 [Glycine max]KAG5146478.1 hypothetical protein JHK84_032021 [Glycine max]
MILEPSCVSLFFMGPCHPGPFALLGVLECIRIPEFVKNIVKTEDYPSDGLPEFALVGRSNVRKSSLLNSLVRWKKLTLTLKKPVHCWTKRSSEYSRSCACIY